MVEPSVQVRYAPASTCFGCGPANDRGLQIAGHETDGDVLEAEWLPAPHHAAFPGVLNGGIIGTLLDCHSNWAAAIHLMRAHEATRPPACVTAEFHVRLLRPTPTDAPVRLRAWVVEASADRATTESELRSGNVVTATCRGVFVAVRPGHPAYERWDPRSGEV